MIKAAAPDKTKKSVTPLQWCSKHDGVLYSSNNDQGRTDPMGIRAMPWDPPPKGAHQICKNNANQQKSVTKKTQLSFDEERKIVK